MNSLRTVPPVGETHCCTSRAPYRTLVCTTLSIGAFTFSKRRTHSLASQPASLLRSVKQSFRRLSSTAVRDDFIHYHSSAAAGALVADPQIQAVLDIEKRCSPRRRPKQLVGTPLPASNFAETSEWVRTAWRCACFVFLPVVAPLGNPSPALLRPCRCFPKNSSNPYHRRIVGGSIGNHGRIGAQADSKPKLQRKDSRRNVVPTATNRR